MERSNRTLWIGFGLIALFVLFALPMGGMHAFGAPGGPGYRPYVGGPGGPMMWGFFGFGLLRILFFGLIIFLAVRLFRGFGWARYRGDYRGHSGYAGYRDYPGYPEPEREEDIASPMDLPASEILRRRYAAGEITREQFDEMRRTLEPSAPTSPSTPGSPNSPSAPSSPSTPPA